MKFSYLISYVSKRQLGPALLTNCAMKYPVFYLSRQKKEKAFFFSLFHFIFVVLFLLVCSVFKCGFSVDR